MYFEMQNAFQNVQNCIFFQKKKKLNKKGVLTLPKIFRSVTQNTLIFFINLA